MSSSISCLKAETGLQLPQSHIPGACFLVAWLPSSVFLSRTHILTCGVWKMRDDEFKSSSGVDSAELQLHRKYFHTRPRFTTPAVQNAEKRFLLFQQQQRGAVKEKKTFHFQVKLLHSGFYELHGKDDVIWAGGHSEKTSLLNSESETADEERSRAPQSGWCHTGTVVALV